MISEFHTRAEEEVTAISKACLLCKRQNVQAPDDDSKKSSYAAETDAEETPKKKWIKSTPSTTKPPPSAAVGRAPKGTGIDEIKGLDNDELDYNDDVGSDDAGGNPVQAPEPPQDEKSQDSGKPSDEQCHPSGDGSARHPGGSHSDHKKSRGRSKSGSESRSPCGSCSPLLLATEFILVTGSVMETEVETRTTDLIEDLTILMTMTGTILTMTSTMMTGFTTLTAGIMAAVMTGDMMTGVHTGLIPIGLHLLQGLMTV